MNSVIAAISMSLDGFITGPNDGASNGLGDGGEVLHEWIFQRPMAEHPVLGPMLGGSGAMITGRLGWDIAGHAWLKAKMFPFGIFVLTHRPEPDIVDGETTVRFVDDTIANVVAQAREVCAADKVVSLHGATSIQQTLNAGLLDELVIHQVPVLLGAGKRLFDHLDGPAKLECTRVYEESLATHLFYQVVR